MSSVLKSIRLHSRIVQAYYKTFVVVYVIAAIIAIITRTPPLAMAIVIVISAPFMGLYFSVYEKNNLSNLYGILPLGRFHVVLGRYLYALGFILVNGIVSGVWAYIVSRLANIGISYLAVATYSSGAFLYSCLFIAVQFPIYSRFRFSRVYGLSNLPFYLVIVFGFFLFRKTNLLAQPSQMIQYITAHQNLIEVVGIATGLVLLMISCPVSYLIYQRNEL